MSNPEKNREGPVSTEHTVKESTKTKAIGSRARNNAGGSVTEHDGSAQRRTGQVSDDIESDMDFTEQDGSTHSEGQGRSVTI
jgi:hypothetical protein